MPVLCCRYTHAGFGVPPAKGRAPNMTSNTIRAAIYCRISKDQHDEKLASSARTT